MPERRVRTGRLLGSAFLLFLLQICVVHRFSVSWGQPQLVCLMAAFLALYAPVEVVMWGALGLGMLRDVGSVGKLGLSPLVFIPAAALILLCRERFYRGGAIDIVLAFIFMLLVSMLEATLTVILNGGISLAGVGAAVFGQSLLSAALALPLFFTLEQIGVVIHRERPVA